MKRLLAIAFLISAVTLAPGNKAYSAPGAEKKKEVNYGYKVFDLKAQLEVVAHDQAKASAFQVTNPIYFKSLKARTTNNDTLSNAGTKTQYGDIGYHPRSLTIQVDLNKISGTAAGKLILEASVDGINYVRIAKTDSLVIANVTSQRKIFMPDGLDLRYRYFQTKAIGTGSQSVRMNTRAYALY